eukprot:COSAG02_NODE_7560_length_2960_cov_13.200629_2_plen_326_part_00
MQAEARRELGAAVAAMTAALGEMRDAGSPAVTLERHAEAIARCATTLAPPVELMRNPLVVDATKSDNIVDGAEHSKEVSLVVADADGATLATIRLGLNGPAAVPVVLWDGIYALGNLIGLVMTVIVITPLIDPSLRPIAYWLAGTMLFVGTPLNYRAVRGLRASIADDAEPPGGGMWQLLRCEVSAQAAEEMAEATQNAAKAWKGQLVGTAVFHALVGSFILLYSTMPPTVLIGVFVASWLCSVVEAVTGNLGTALVPAAACTIVEDKALRLSLRLRAAGGLSIAKRGEELDQFLVSLNELDQDLRTVASIAQPGIAVSTAHTLG